MVYGNIHKSQIEFKLKTRQILYSCIHITYKYKYVYKKKSLFWRYKYLRNMLWLENLQLGEI